MKQILEERMERAKKKGTVLMTVVGVMMVLVVFLISTLVLTASSNRRSYYTYFETQAQYAAQAALDAVTNSAYSNNAFYNWVSTKVTKEAGPQAVTVDFADTSSIQFTNKNKVVECTIERVDDDYIWDADTKAIHGQRAWKITATASVGTGRNRSDYTVVNYIYENYRPSSTVLDNSVANNAAGKSYNYNYDPGTGGGKRGSLIGAMSRLSASNTNNNVYCLGPNSVNLSAIPLGRGFYSVNGGQTGYNLNLTNDAYIVGEALFVNNVTPNSANGFSVEFQKRGEGAVFYGNYTGGNSGVSQFYANVSANHAPKNYNDVNYVYVDGVMNAGAVVIYVGYKGNGTQGSHPVNLYAGAVKGANGKGVALYGDAYLFDPNEDSVWQNPDGTTRLAKFAGNNINKADNKYEGNVGGSIFSVNNSLTIKGGNSGLIIDGDVVFANPLGTLTIDDKVTVNGRVICAGTYNGSIPLTPYDSYKSDIYDDTKTGIYDFSLYPFSARPDEIMKRYYRWDMKSTNSITVDDAFQRDELLRESWACGHDWYIDTITLKDETYKTEYVYEHHHDEYDRICTGDEMNQYGYWNGYTYTVIPGTAENGWVQTYSVHVVNDYDELKETKVVSTEGTPTTYYVPYTVPKGSTAFIDVFRPQSKATSILDLALSEEEKASYSKYNIQTIGQFMQMMSSTAEYNGSAVTGVPVFYHDAQGNEQTATLGKTYVVNSDCVIDLSKYRMDEGANFFIDPGSHNDANPLFILLKGGNIDPYKLGDIIINNTAIYNQSDYTKAKGADNGPKSYASQCGIDSTTGEYVGVYAGRREVYIFMENGLQISGNPVKIICTGAYGQAMTNTFNVVSNPVYPTKANSLTTITDPALRYSYELVPNTMVFGEYKGWYNFKNGGMIHAEVIMPTATFDVSNSSNYQATVTYREDWNCQAYTIKKPMFCLGSQLSDVDTGSNVAMTVYIGDGNRGGAPGLLSSSNSQNSSSNDLGQTYKDYFSNDHQGAH